MKKIKLLMLIVAFNVVAGSDEFDAIADKQVKPQLITIQNENQIRIHQFFKSEKTGEFISFTSLINKNTSASEPSVELIITTESGQFIISQEEKILLGDSRFDDFKLGEESSLTKSQVFFSDLVFEEFIGLNLAQESLSDDKVFDQYLNLLESFNGYGASACQDLEKAINRAFAELAWLESIGSPNVKAFYNIVIVPMLFEFAAQCIGEV